MPWKNHPHLKLATGKQARQETRARHGYSPHSSSSSASAAPSCGSASAGEGEGAAMAVREVTSRSRLGGGMDGSPSCPGFGLPLPAALSRRLSASLRIFFRSSLGRWESIPASGPPPPPGKTSAQQRGPRQAFLWATGPIEEVPAAFAVKAHVSMLFWAIYTEATSYDGPAR